ncbi:MAG: Hsp20/alpha crystallin family protein [Christensenellales bacterium]
MDLITRNNKRNEVYTDNFDDFFKPFFNFNRNMMNMKTDIQECKDKYIVEVDLPGLDKKDIDLNIEDDYLNICVNKSEDLSEKDRKGNYIRRERHFGSQCRSFYIGDVNEQNIHATYNKGILRIDIPKKDIKENSSKKRISIE